MRRWLCATVVMAGLCGVAGGGCVHGGRAVAARYAAMDTPDQPVTLRHGGDFALFYDDHRDPEIPIRLRAGDQLGFAPGKDGRVQAVAGEFRINVASDAQCAYWKRLNYAGEN